MTRHRLLPLFVLALAFPAAAATFNVTNLNDSGAGSLRAAIASANATLGADTITFQAGLTGTITLSSALEVEESLTINGPGSNMLTISGNDQVGVFYFIGWGNEPETHSVSGLTITDGNPIGDSAGGGIGSFGCHLTLNDVIVKDCHSGADGGGLYFTGRHGFAMGGTLTITNSSFTGNIAFNGTLPAGDCSIIEIGPTGGRGGGIFVEEAQTVTMTSVTVSNNGSLYDAGGIAVLASMSGASIITLNNAVVTNNLAAVTECLAASAGGIWVAGLGEDDTLNINDSTISNNDAPSGNAGGLMLGELAFCNIRRTTISGNEAGDGDGGGVRFSNEDVLLENVTISGNTAAGHGGAFITHPFEAPAGFLVRNSTISNNSGGWEGGIYAKGGAVVTLRNSIVANSINSNTNAASDDIVNDGTSSFVLIYSLVEQPGTAAIDNLVGNILNQDPQLGVLQNNGGTTLTHKPASAGPAVGSGEPSIASPPATDQRGMARIVGGRIDMGSVEVEPSPGEGTFSLSSGTYDVGENAGTVTITVQRLGGSTGSVSVAYATSAGTASAGSDYVTTSGTLNWSAGDSTSKTFTVTISDGNVYESDETFIVTLSNPTGGAIINGSSAVVTIDDDDQYPQANVGNASKTEGNAGTSLLTFAITLTNPAESVSIGIDYETVHSTAGAGDYTPLTGSVTFSPGQITKNVSVTIAGDTASEFDEVFLLKLTGGDGAYIVDDTGIGTIVNDDPPPPVTNLVATATTSTKVALTWVAAAGATSYEVQRQAPGVAFTPIATVATNSYDDLTVAAGTAYRYRIRSINAAGSAIGASDLATTVIFTDATLTSIIKVKAIHTAELRTAINAVRTLAGLAAATYTNTAAAGTTIRGVDVTQMRTALDAALTALAMPVAAYTDPSLAAVKVKAIHFDELRNRVR
jgi:hypothetical protein